MFINSKPRLLISAIFGLSLCNLLQASSSTFTGHITYTLNKVANPTADQSDAYTKITSGMDSAVWFYNTYTTITKKLTVEYKPDVQTADGNSNGNIRFGKSRSYMKGCTAMHEIAHTTGIGTTQLWLKLIRFPDKIYLGAIALQKYKEIKNDPKAVLKGDSMHFWDYGLNYDTEVKSKDDLVNHCFIVDAMQKDLYPSQIIADAGEKPQNNFSIIMNSGNIVTYTIPLSGLVSIGIYSVSGQKIAEITQGMMSAGSHLLSINTINLPYGNYIFQLNAGQSKQNYLFPIIKNHL
jgi:hypothetical protein